MKDFDQKYEELNNYISCVDEELVELQRTQGLSIEEAIEYLYNDVTQNIDSFFDDPRSAS